MTKLDKPKPTNLQEALDQIEDLGAFARELATRVESLERTQAELQAKSQQDSAAALNAAHYAIARTSRRGR